MRGTTDSRPNGSSLTFIKSIFPPFHGRSISRLVATIVTGTLSTLATRIFISLPGAIALGALLSLLSLSLIVTFTMQPMPARRGDAVRLGVSDMGTLALTVGADLRVVEVLEKLIISRNKVEHHSLTTSQSRSFRCAMECSCFILRVERWRIGLCELLKSGSEGGATT